MGKMKSGKVKLQTQKPKAKVVVVEKPMIKKKPQGNTQARPSASSGLFQTLGGAAGGFFGGPLGAQLGSTAGKFLSKIVGFGDYKVDANTLVRGNTVPSFGATGNGSLITHHEFLMDVTGSILFDSTSFPINPGMLDTFPWLALVATNFEEYDLEGLVFVYKPTSGTALASANAAMGVVIMTTDYDALNPPFTSKQQMESYEFSTSTAPYTGCIHPVECAKGQNVLNSLYTRSSAIPSGADLRMYDMGNFQIATVGMQSAYVVGELHVSYSVRLKKPRIPPTPILVFYMKMKEGPANTAASATVFGTTAAIASANSYFPGVVPVDTNSLLFTNAGDYFCMAASVGGTITGVHVISTGANIALTNLQFVQDTIAYEQGLGSASLSSITIFAVKVTASGSTSANYFNLTSCPGLAAGTTDVLIYPMLDESVMIRSDDRSFTLVTSFADRLRKLNLEKSPESDEKKEAFVHV